MGSGTVGTVVSQVVVAQVMGKAQHGGARWWRAVGCSKGRRGITAATSDRLGEAGTKPWSCSGGRWLWRRDRWRETWGRWHDRHGRVSRSTAVGGLVIEADGGVGGAVQRWHPHGVEDGRSSSGVVAGRSAWAVRSGRVWVVTGSPASTGSSKHRIYDDERLASSGGLVEGGPVVLRAVGSDLGGRAGWDRKASAMGKREKVDVMRRGERILGKGFGVRWRLPEAKKMGGLSW